MDDTNKPETTSAPARDTATDEPVAPLVEIENPAKQTDKDINAKTGDGLKQDDGPNADAAETMAKNRDIAKGKDVEKPYFHGQGGAADV